jgi:predicted nucleic acid-binding protein
MSEGITSPVVLDATVLSNYAYSDSIQFLISTVEELYTVPAVRTELEAGTAAGYSELERALTALEEGRIGIDTDAPARLDTEYTTVRSRLDAGEAEALVTADTTDGTLATDDGTARTLAADYQVSLTGSVGLLVRGVVSGAISTDTADDWLTTWVEERNYYAPVSSVTDALPSEFDS